MMIQKEVRTAQEMEQMGGVFYRSRPKGGLIIYLKGDLGAGKTTFVRGFLRAMHYYGIVKSPTFTLVEPYELAENKVFHFDFYRLNASQELEYMGIRDYFQNEAYCLIEWPEKAKETLPLSDITVAIDITGTSRRVSFQAYSERGKDVLQALNQAV